jgi:AraC family transcriptional regulator
MTLKGHELGGLPEFRLRRVREYIEANLRRPLRLTELSAVVNMSPFHFARLFKRSTGLSPHQFVLRVRIAAASVLLDIPGASVGTVARQVGFRTPSHFSTTYRRLTGNTPSAYQTRPPDRAGLAEADVRVDGS